jgi:hypothetical protein
MVAGQRYCVKFYTSLADGAKWATDDIGVYLSNTLFTKNFCSTPGPHSVTPPTQLVRSIYYEHYELGGTEVDVYSTRWRVVFYNR